MSKVEITLSSAKDLKNVNWRHGPTRPYAAVWVDPDKKSYTKADDEGDICPYWDETLVLPLQGPVDDDTTVYIDIVHSGNSEEESNKLIGSTKLNIKDILDEAGYGERIKRTLKLKRPSGRPHGKIDVTVSVREPRYRSRDAYYAPPYGVPPPNASRDYSGNPYGAAPPQYGNPYGDVAAPPTAGYPYANQQHGYGEARMAPAGCYRQEEKKESKFGGMGMGLAVGAVAGVLGGVALAEGFDALQDNIAEDAAEKVEEDLEEEGDSE